MELIYIKRIKTLSFGLMIISLFGLTYQKNSMASFGHLERGECEDNGGTYYNYGSGMTECCFPQEDGEICLVCEITTGCKWDTKTKLEFKSILNIGENLAPDGGTTKKTPTNQKAPAKIVAPY